MSSDVFTTIEGFGATSLVESGSNYFLYPDGGSAVELSYAGAPVVDGQFDQFGGHWVPIGAEQTASGYEVAWKVTGADQYAVWVTDNSGNYVSNTLDAVSGTSAALQSFETSFQQDLNDDGSIGPPPPSPTVIELNGATSLTEIANHYYLYDSTGAGPSLKYGAADYVAGQFGTWAPIAAEQTASGYEVAWKVTGADQYAVWVTDNSGNYVSNTLDAVSGTSAALQSFETSFQQDLNDDGSIGPPPPSPTVIESNGATSLTEIANHYYLYDSTGAGPSLKYGAADYVAGQFGTWAPIAAEQTASGYEVAWKVTGADQYAVWATDISGNYVSNTLDAVSGTSAALQSFEPSFQQDLNGDGLIGLAAVSPPQFVYQGVDGNGVQLYSVTWDTLGSHPFAVRVLAPDDPSTDYAHSLLYALPVEGGLAQSTWGSGLDELRQLGVENQYNATIIEPIFPIDPWYADNPLDATIDYETFMATLLPAWVNSNFATSGTEDDLLIGFSKSGYGALDLLFKYPAVFDAAAAWDFPADMTAYSNYGASGNYGTDSNFQNNYRLTGAFIDTWKAPFTTQDRIWISGYDVFETDVSDFDTLLTSHGVLHTLSTQTYDAHNWSSGWVSDAVAGLYGLVDTTPTDTTAPATPAAPADSAVVNGYVNVANDTAAQALTGTTENGSTVTIYDKGTQVATTTANATTGAWSFGIGTLADASAHSYTVTATDAAGNVSQPSAALNFTVDTTPPATPATPTDGAVVNGYVNAANDTAAQALTGTTENGSTVTIYDKGTQVATTTANATTGAWSFGIGTLADASAHSYTVTATDAAGNVSQPSAALNFTVDTTPPATPATPTDSAVVNGYVNAANDTAAQALTGTTENGSTVTIYDKGTQVATTTANATTGAWSFGIGTLADASAHSYTVTATDAAGNVSQTSDALVFTVDTTAPAVTEKLANDTGAFSSDRITSDPTLTGAGDPNAVVHFTVDGAPIASTTTADSSGIWNFAPTGLADGSHTIGASEMDAVGNTGTASLTFTLDTHGPIDWQFTLANSNFDGSASIASGTVIGSVKAIGDPNSSMFTYFFAANVAGTQGVTQNINGLAIDPNTGVLTTTAALSGWPTMWLIAEDQAGNISSRQLIVQFGTANGDTNLSIASGTTVTFALGGSDTITGTSGADAIAGGLGNDFINGFVGADTVNSGAGNDTIVLSAMSVDLNTATDAQIVNVEVVSAASAAAGVTIDLHSQSEGFTITGSASADIITGGVAADNITAGSGNDTIIGFGGHDTVNGGVGTDTIILSAMSVDLNTATDAQIVNVEAVTAASAAAGVTIDLHSQSEGFTITGSASADIITGGVAADNITAGSGNDTIIGFGGHDTVNGGVGTDTIVLSATSTNLNTATDAQIANVEVVGAASAAAGVALDLHSQSEGFAITGSASADIISGGAGADNITAGSGNDTIAGLVGADLLDGGADADTATYAASLAGVSVSLATGLGSGGDAQGDTLINIENLTGSAFNDVFTGSPGVNVLNGGGGADTLTGGAGSDKFLLSATTDSTPGASDVITDFVHGTDIIDLSAIDANTSSKAKGDQAFAFALPEPYSNVVANSVTWFESGGNTIVQADVNGNTTADLTIVLTGLNHNLTASDFIL